MNVFAMNVVLARAMVLVMLAGSTQGCCFRSCAADVDGADVDGADVDGAEAGSTADPGDLPATALEIVGWGPSGTRAGVVFNAQQNGQAALWIRLGAPLDAGTAWIRFGDAFLESQVSGDTVTALVPPEVYATPGVYEVGVVARKGRAQSRSNTVPFTVE